MKPLLKWAGGKRQIAPVLQQHLPADWNQGTYFEPFFGGGAIFLHLLPKTAQISDVNPRLIGFYEDVRDQPDALLSLIRQIASKFNETQMAEKQNSYLALRSRFNAEGRSLESSALFFALNKLCFNGLYRENARGEFNVPFGQKKEFPALFDADFFQVSKALADTRVLLADFEHATEGAKRGDFVYFDPPYIPLTPTASFTSYSSTGFGLDAQVRLAQTMASLRDRGVRVMMSNSSTLTTEEIFSDFRQVTISAPRNVGAKASSRGSVNELLVMSY